MKIAAVQHDIVWEDGPATRGRVAPLIGQAAAAGARLIVLTEMYATGFSMRPERVAEPPGGPNEQFLADQAAAHGVWLLGSIAQWATEDPETPGTELDNRRAQNVAVLAGPDGQRHRYAKIHPFSYAGEHEHYRAGTEFLTLTVEDLRVSVFVCYDLRFADEFWALAPDTDIYVVVANWPEPRREHWKALLRARAIENQAYLVGVNRVGTGDDIRYTGDSVILDPLGRPLAEASLVETVLVADADAGEVKRIRDRFPFLADRRTAEQPPADPGPTDRRTAEQRPAEPGPTDPRPADPRPAGQPSADR
ncbi:MAG TPA: nitrilase-related carbon-nitrogen hydrolase [Jatrophihabitans sp.]|nr:nitrilase-related carbon-nitrogen hydrolase [Jatrophihabitans sp.]